jgi:purine-binding chemotaxis protein CheW
MLSLVCSVDTRLCAVPLEHVVETMRPLPTGVLAGAPQFVQGVSIVRGEVVPVVDVASLLGAGESRPTRLVTISVGRRRVALAVDAVLGVRAVSGGSVGELPPLLGDVGTGVISAIGTLDAELLLVLRSARLIPESVWALVDQEVSPL